MQKKDGHREGSSLLTIQRIFPPLRKPDALVFKLDRETPRLYLLPLDPSPPPLVPPPLPPMPLPLLMPPPWPAAPLPLELPMPLVPGVELVPVFGVPSVLGPWLLVRGPVVVESTGSVGPVDPANAEPVAAQSRLARVRAVSFVLIMM
jgi:hypothetical protein